MTDLRLEATSMKRTTSWHTGLLVTVRLTNHASPGAHHANFSSLIPRPRTFAFFLIDTKAIRNALNSPSSNAETVSNRHRSGPSPRASFHGSTRHCAPSRITGISFKTNNRAAFYPTLEQGGRRNQFFSSL